MQTGGIPIPYRQFSRKSRRAKRRWFSRYLKRAGQRDPAVKQRTADGFGRRERLWQLVLAGAALLAAYGAFWTARRTAVKTEMNYYEASVPSGQPGVFEESSPSGTEGRGWEQEIFGVKLRFEDGQIIFFKEKKEIN
ncbi:MAG: hypothetical protein Q4F29_04180 [Lachnospiraceae bacterium]|nr:hypothetical protein [Lachnospiraceae bacterium]